MHWSILTRYLMALLVISFIHENNGEIRVKRDLQVITDILKHKLDSFRNLSRSVINVKPLPPMLRSKPNVAPEPIETHAEVGLQAIVTPYAEPCKTEPIQVIAQEIKPMSNQANYYYKQIRDDGTAMIYTSNDKGGVDVTDTRYKVPEDELKPMPYGTKYLYTQIQNEGDSSGVVYTLNNRGQVQVSNIRDIPLNTGNNIIQSAYASQSGLTPIVTPDQSFDKVARPIRPIQLIQNAKVTPEYSYKMLHRDGSATTYLGNGDVKRQQFRFGEVDHLKPIPDPPAYLVNRIENVAANTVCIERPYNSLCKYSPSSFRYDTVPFRQVGILPFAAPVRYTYGENNGYNTLSAVEVKDVPKEYIYVPPVSGFDAPQPVSSDKQNQESQISIDDIKTSINEDTQAKSVEPAQQGTFMYKQMSADGSDMTVRGKGKEGVSVDFNENGANTDKAGRGDIPERRSY